MNGPSDDKDWATKYLLDPLTDPEPNQVTGPGTHFHPVMDKKIQSTSNYPTPPTSASPSRASFPHTNPFHSSHRKEAYGSYAQDGPSSSSKNNAKPGQNSRERSSSLGQRYPGDVSHRPLDIIRKQTKKADRSPHLKKKHLPGADLIDSLDSSMDQLYHHEGPYDATLLSRNTRKDYSPLEAVKNSNAEALKATPKEHIRDALDRHVPLQGVAIVPPGYRNMSGEVMDYEEGTDLMRDQDAPGGAYKRWEGVKYLDADYKGKGEPSFSLERALKKTSDHRRVASAGNSVYEMQARARPPHQRTASGTGSEFQTSAMANSTRYADVEGDMRRNSSTGRKIGEVWRRRLGSLRRSKKPSGDGGQGSSSVDA